MINRDDKARCVLDALTGKSAASIHFIQLMKDAGHPVEMEVCTRKGVDEVPFDWVWTRTEVGVLNSAMGAWEGHTAAHIYKTWNKSLETWLEKYGVTMVFTPPVPKEEG